jgi:hypothetical protein
MTKEDLPTMMTLTAKATYLLVALLFAAIAAAAQPADLYTEKESSEEAAAELAPPPPGVTGDQIFRELLHHNDLRNSELKHYSEMRTYEVKNPTGKLYAQEIVQMDYQAPATKTFAAKSEQGSGLVRSLVFKRLLESETEAAAGKEHHDSSITPVNYSLELLGQQQVGSYYCFVVQAVPKRQDKYLFAGTIWIDAQDFAIVKIAGHPAKKPSFWIEQADFVRQYQNINGFWLPLKDETVVHVRLKGIKILTIEHQAFAVNSDGALDAQQVQNAADSPEQLVGAMPTDGRPEQANERR